MSTETNRKRIARSSAIAASKAVFVLFTVVLGMAVLVWIIAVQSSSDQYGDSGRLEIKRLGIGVALYSDKGQAKDLQELVDDEDSAAIMWQGDICFIADHNSQEFYRLNECLPGYTGVIRTRDGMEKKLICTHSLTGTNDTHTLYTDNGSPISTLYDNYSDIVVIYTCLDDEGTNVYITVWKIDNSVVTENPSDDDEEETRPLINESPLNNESPAEEDNNEETDDEDDEDYDYEYDADEEITPPLYVEITSATDSSNDNDYETDEYDFTDENDEYDNTDNDNEDTERERTTESSEYDIMSDEDFFFDFETADETE